MGPDGIGLVAGFGIVVLVVGGDYFYRLWKAASRDACASPSLSSSVANSPSPSTMKNTGANAIPSAEGT
jgi:hypothetical protein